MSDLKVALWLFPFIHKTWSARRRAARSRRWPWSTGLPGCRGCWRRGRCRRRRPRPSSTPGPSALTSRCTARTTRASASSSSPPRTSPPPEVLHTHAHAHARKRTRAHTHTHVSHVCLSVCLIFESQNVVVAVRYCYVDMAFNHYGLFSSLGHCVFFGLPSDHIHHHWPPQATV